MEVSKSQNKLDLPLVSVIVPSYNHENYIRECIHSIYNQTYSNFELIVIDDGSKDSSRNILTELQSRYGFKLIFQENHGIAYTLNRGIKEFSNGEYITFCASDDVWLESKLNLQINYMLSNKSCPMCYGKALYINENSEILKRKEVKYKGGYIFNDIFLFNMHPPVNYLFRRSIFDEVGYYDENVFAEDFSMNLKIASKYPIGYIDEYLFLYRLTAQNIKIANFDKLSASHSKTVDEYIFHPLYKKSKATISLRNLDLYSGYRGYKRKALTFLFPSMYLFYKKRFIRSIIKLLLFNRKLIQ